MATQHDTPAPSPAWLDAASPDVPAVQRLPAEQPRPPRPSGQPAWLFHGSVPSLDGLRAVSILLVIVGHLSLRPEPAFSWLPRAGEMGVEMFFVISGFLITLLLERERRRTGTVSLKRFYIRRCLRILPAYVFFLAALFALQLRGYLDIPWGAWLTAMTYTTSLVSLAPSWDLGHTWSLAVEEHFYLVWPLLFLVLNRRRAFLACAACVAAGPFLRMALYRFVFLPHGGVGMSFCTFTQMDCIAVGCCLALLATSPACRKLWPGRRVAACLCLGSAVLLVASKVAAAKFSSVWAILLYQSFLSPSANSLLMALLVWGSINHGGALLYGLLNCRLFRVLGLLSYSLYLWQQPLINPERGGWAFQFPANMVLLLLVACLSYTLVESPFLKLKQRFANGRAPRAAGREPAAGCVEAVQL